MSRLIKKKTHVSSKASVGEGDVRSNLLEFLHLHKLAPLDSEAVSEDMKHAERERTDAGQESQRITWRDPEAPESLRAFEKELEDLGNPAVQPTSSPPLSFHTVTKDHDSSSEDTYLDKLLRGEVAAPAQASAVPGLRAMGTKFAWKTSMRTSAKLNRSHLAERTQESIDVDKIIITSLYQDIKRLFAQRRSCELRANRWPSPSSINGVPQGVTVQEREERRYVIGDENASNDYFEVYNRAIELFDKRREDTYHYLPCEVVHAAALDLLAWCEKVGEANLAVLIVEATVAFAPDRAKDVIPGLYAVLTRTKYVPNHDKLVARAFTALEPHLVAGAEPCADTVPLIVMSLQSCLSYRGKANEKEIVTDREAGYFTEHEPAMEFTALNDSRILRHLEILAQHPGGPLSANGIVCFTIHP